MFLCLVFHMLLRLFIAALSTADLLALVGNVYYIFVTFPCGILCQVWYLIVLFPDLCRLPYFCYYLAHNEILIDMLYALSLYFNDSRI